MAKCVAAKWLLWSSLLLLVWLLGAADPCGLPGGLLPAGSADPLSRQGGEGGSPGGSPSTPLEGVGEEELESSEDESWEPPEEEEEERLISSEEEGWESAEGEESDSSPEEGSPSPLPTYPFRGSCRPLPPQPSFAEMMERIRGARPATLL